MKKLLLGLGTLAAVAAPVAAVVACGSNDGSDKNSIVFKLKSTNGPSQDLKMEIKEEVHVVNIFCNSDPAKLAATDISKPVHGFGGSMGSGDYEGGTSGIVVDKDPSTWTKEDKIDTLMNAFPSGLPPETDTVQRSYWTDDLLKHVKFVPILYKTAVVISPTTAPKDSQSETSFGSPQETVNTLLANPRGMFSNSPEATLKVFNFLDSHATLKNIIRIKITSDVNKEEIEKSIKPIRDESAKIKGLHLQGNTYSEADLATIKNDPLFAIQLDDKLRVTNYYKYLGDIKSTEFDTLLSSKGVSPINNIL